MSTKDRLYEFLSAKNLKASKFEQQCGLSNGFCSKVGDNITDGSIALIKKAFPELNINWLKTGSGDMITARTLGSHNHEEYPNAIYLLNIMQDLLILGNKNADANIMNAETNKLNAQNLERLITVIENKLT